MDTCPTPKNISVAVLAIPSAAAMFATQQAETPYARILFLYESERGSRKLCLIVPFTYLIILPWRSVSAIRVSY